MARADTDRLETMLDESLREKTNVGLSTTVLTGRRPAGGGNPTSWDQLAFNIQSITGISVSGEWLRGRFVNLR